MQLIRFQAISEKNPENSHKKIIIDSDSDDDEISALDEDKTIKINEDITIKINEDTKSVIEISKNTDKKIQRRVKYKINKKIIRFWSIDKNIACLQIKVTGTL